MMNFLNTDWRDRRNILNQGMSFGPMHYTISNYSTTTKIEDTTNMKVFEEDILSKIQSIPDPLKKNLADTVITSNKNKEDLSTPVEDKEFYFEANITPENMNNMSGEHRGDFYPSLSGITSFFSNFFGAISGAMFQRRPKSPVPQYFDCFDCDSHMNQEMAGMHWQTSNLGDQNKKRALDGTSVVDNMNNCRAAVAQCEDKLNAVRSLLKTKPVPTTTTTRVHYRRSRNRKAFIEPGAVTNNTEDFSADNYVSLSNEEYVEYIAIPNNIIKEYSDIEAPKMKTEIAPMQNSPNIVNILPDVIDKDVIPKVDVITAENTPVVVESVQNDEKKEVISSCEDKMAKLKAMLQEKRKKPSRTSAPVVPVIETTESVPQAIAHQSVPIVTEPEPIQPPVTHKPPIKPTKTIPKDKKQDKKFKNPHRLREKRTKTKVRKNIQDDMVFANEIDSEDISSVENSPAAISHMQRVPQAIPIKPKNEYFNELKGKFQSATPDSDDSFQIVFSDSPKLSHLRRPSDCDSEDSFIVFEDSPDSCYTSNDVFGDHMSSDEDDSDLSDSDSEISDSGCPTDICKLSHSFSRTVSDLTDDSLYEDSKPIEDTDIVKDVTLEGDEVDCAVNICDKILSEDIKCAKDSVKTGLLIDEEKKRKRKGQPPKRVTFSDKPPKVHVMRVWAFASKQARCRYWEQYAVDRERFKRRIADVDMAVSWVLKPQHRRRIMFQRFMPWWNQLKRKEAAEKKIKEEKEKLKKQQEVCIEEDFNTDVKLILEYEEKLFEYISEYENRSREMEILKKGFGKKNCRKENLEAKVGFESVNSCVPRVES